MKNLIINPAITAYDIVESFMGGRSGKTVIAYRKDMQYFALFRQEANVVKALGGLMREQPGHANMIAENYKSAMLEANLAPNTVNRRLSSLRSVVKFARRLGFINWSLDVENVPVENIRSVSGPTVDEIKRLFDAVTSIRDRAILSLFWPCLLRRTEIIEICMSDLRDLSDNILWIRRKGRRQKEPIGIPAHVCAILEELARERGPDAELLFGLTDTRVYQIIKGLAGKAGIDPNKISPHKFRHAGATQLIGLKADMQQVQEALGHRSLATTSRYVDNMVDKGAQARELLTTL